MLEGPRPKRTVRPGALAAPVLTLPAEEAALLREAYGAAGVILEYGSGGSTVLAASMPGKAIFSVESDATWLGGLRAHFVENPGASPVILHHGDIGPTGKWGAPKDRAHILRWPGYALSVWDRPDFRHPDVVLVDGRFRLACLLTTLTRITRPTRVLVDDYAERKPYHSVEEFARPTRIVGRMADFTLIPTTLPPEKLNWFVQSFLRPQ